MSAAEPTKLWWTAAELNPLPPREALEYFRSKGYAPALQRFDYRDHWREEHARAFVVAKAMRDDVLEMIRSSTDDALANGTTLETFRQELAPKLRAAGWWGKSIERDPRTGELREVELGSMRRLKVIFDTNLRTSYAAGQWARLQRTKAFLPYLEYRQLQRETRREEHEPFHGLILPIDHPLWRVIFPPNGWFCGCHVRPMNDRMLEREGKRLTTDEELADLMVSDWTNPRTGVTEPLLDGIDPSFASNPGQAWQDTNDRHQATVLDLPDLHASTDRGYLQELAALRLRDARSAALLYRLDAGPEAAPIGMSRASPGELGSSPLPRDLRAAMAASDTELVLLRGEAAGSGIPLSDVMRMSRFDALRQVAVQTPDGSILRISRAAQTNVTDTDLQTMDALARRAFQLGIDTFSIEETDLIVSHGILRFLADRGQLQYASGLSGRTSGILMRAAELLDEIATALDGWFGGRV